MEHEGEPFGIPVSPPPCQTGHRLWITELPHRAGLCYKQEKYKSVTTIFLFFRSAEVL